MASHDAGCPLTPHVRRVPRRRFLRGGALPAGSRGRHRVERLGLLLTTILPLTGCQSGDHGRSITNQLAVAEYENAYRIACREMTPRSLADDRQDAAHHLLEAGRTAQLAGRPDESIKWYDAFYDRVDPYLDELPEATIREIAAAMVLNPRRTTYRGWASDRVLAAALNATNQLDLGEVDRARRSLLTAQTWQDHANNRFREEVSCLTQSLPRIGEDAESPLNSTWLRERLEDVTAREFGGMAAFHDSRAPENPLENPFIIHLRGVFLSCFGMDQADADEATRSIEIAASLAGLTPDALTPLTSEPTTFVYFLTGLGPRLETRKITIPVPVGINELGLQTAWFVMAFPVMLETDSYLPVLNVAAGGKYAPGQLLADMDRIVSAEFLIKLELVLLQAAVSGMGKAGATWMLAPLGLDPFANLANYFSADADTRIWRSIPKQILVARVPTPEDGRILLRARGAPQVGNPIGSMVEATARVTPGASNLVLATLPSKDARRMSLSSIPMERTPSD